MNKLLVSLSAMVTLGLVAYWVSVIAAQQAVAVQAPPQRSKIAVFNIAKVLRNYHKANFAGQEIQKKRQEYIVVVNSKRTELADKQKALSTATDPAVRDKIQKEALEIQRKIEDIDREAQKTLSQMSNDTIVRVYADIKGVVEAVAVANGFELVFAYPDASLPTEENTPAVAQLKLQTPAAMPFYHRHMDVTEVVIQTLNAKFPAPQVTAPTDPNVVPVSNPPANPK